MNREKSHLNGDLSELGKVISKHPFAITGQYGVVGTIAILLGLLFGPILALVPFLGPGGFEAFIEDPLFYIIFVVIGIIVTIVMVRIFTQVVKNYMSLGKHTLILYENGFALRKKSGKHRYHEVWHWEDVEAIKHMAQPMRSRGGTRYDYTVHRFEITGGPHEKVVIDRNYRKVLKAGRRIQREVGQLQLPKSLEQIKRGEALTFGAFDLNQRGIRYKNEVLPWHEVDEVEEELVRDGVITSTITDIGMIFVRRKGESDNWAEELVAHVPNDRLFLKLANYMMGKDKDMQFEEVSALKQIVRSPQRIKKTIFAVISWGLLITLLLMALCAVLILE